MDDKKKEIKKLPDYFKLLPKKICCVCGSLERKSMKQLEGKWYCRYHYFDAYKEYMKQFKRKRMI